MGCWWKTQWYPFGGAGSDSSDASCLASFSALHPATAVTRRSSHSCITLPNQSWSIYRKLCPLPSRVAHPWPCWMGARGSKGTVITVGNTGQPCVNCRPIVATVSPRDHAHHGSCAAPTLCAILSRVECCTPKTLQGALCECASCGKDEHKPSHIIRNFTGLLFQTVLAGCN
jgi:hypothetical protein